MDKKKVFDPTTIVRLDTSQGEEANTDVCDQVAQSELTDRSRTPLTSALPERALWRIEAFVTAASGVRLAFSAKPDFSSRITFEKWLAVYRDAMPQDEALLYTMAIAKALHHYFMDQSYPSSREEWVSWLSEFRALPPSVITEGTADAIKLPDGIYFDDLTKSLFDPRFREMTLLWLMGIRTKVVIEESPHIRVIQAPQFKHYLDKPTAPATVTLCVEALKVLKGSAIHLVLNAPPKGELRASPVSIERVVDELMVTSGTMGNRFRAYCDNTAQSGLAMRLEIDITELSGISFKDLNEVNGRVIADYLCRGIVGAVREVMYSNLLPVKTYGVPNTEFILSLELRRFTDRVPAEEFQKRPARNWHFLRRTSLDSPRDNEFEYEPREGWGILETDDDIDPAKMLLARAWHSNQLDPSGKILVFGKNTRYASEELFEIENQQGSGGSGQPIENLTGEEKLLAVFKGKLLPELAATFECGGDGELTVSWINSWLSQAKGRRDLPKEKVKDVEAKLTLLRDAFGAKVFHIDSKGNAALIGGTNYRERGNSADLRLKSPGARTYDLHQATDFPHLQITL